MAPYQNLRQTWDNKGNKRISRSQMSLLYFFLFSTASIHPRRPFLSAHRDSRSDGRKDSRTSSSSTKSSLLLLFASTPERKKKKKSVGNTETVARAQLMPSNFDK
jgi:hypothetical protein